MNRVFEFLFLPGQGFTGPIWSAWRILVFVALPLALYFPLRDGSHEDRLGFMVAMLYLGYVGLSLIATRVGYLIVLRNRASKRSG